MHKKRHNRRDTTKRGIPPSRKSKAAVIQIAFRSRDPSPQTKWEPVLAKWRLLCAGRVKQPCKGVTYQAELVPRSVNVNRCDEQP
jgi:hypothetical protein